MSDAPLLDIRNLEVDYRVFGGTLHVLDGIDIRVKPGEKIGLVGETGCGKTTAMKSSLGVLPSPPGLISGGEILYRGKNVLNYGQKKMNSIRGREMTMIFQDPMAALNPVFTVGRQFEPVLRHAAGRRLSGSEVREMSIAALKNVALADPERLLDSYPTQLSGGMRQRVCIGMALSTNPKLLIADEPGTALDVTIQAQVLSLLNGLVDDLNTAIILITHSLGVVREMTDRVYVMYAGVIVETAPVRDLFSNPRHPYTRGLMESVPKLSGGGLSSAIMGRIPDYMHPPGGCRFHPRCPNATEECRHLKPALTTVGTDHEVACHLYGGEKNRAESSGKSAPNGASKESPAGGERTQGRNLHA